MSFLFKAKYGLLTYAQCGDLDPWAVSNHLSSLGAECIVGREDHEDGGVHLHCFFMFEGQFRSRNVRVFDVGGCHPNIVRGYGTPEKGWDYATKDGDVCAGGLERPSGKSHSGGSSAWSRIVMAESREEFFDLVEKLDPRSLCIHFGQLRTFADWRFRPEPTPYEHPPGLLLDTSRYPILDEWVEQNVGQLGNGGESLGARHCRPSSGGGYAGAKAPSPPASGWPDTVLGCGGDD